MTIQELKDMVRTRVDIFKEDHPDANIEIDFEDIDTARGEVRFVIKFRGVNSNYGRMYSLNVFTRRNDWVPIFDMQLEETHKRLLESDLKYLHKKQLEYEEDKNNEST